MLSKYVIMLSYVSKATGVTETTTVVVLHNVIVFHYLHLCVLSTALNHAGDEKQVESFSWGGRNLSFICCPHLLPLSQFFCSLTLFAQIYFLLTNS